MLSQVPALLPDKKLKQYILDTIKPDLVHINDKAAMNAGVSLRNTSIPVIQHSRSSYYITKCRISARMSRKSIAGFAAHVIAISEDELDGFERMNNTSVIYNTVDFAQVDEAIQQRNNTRASLGVSNQDLVVGFAASVTEKKGAWDFLEIVRALKEEKNIRFLMVGHIPEQASTQLSPGNTVPMSPAAYINEFITANKLEQRFILTGFRKDSLNLIAAMDLLVVPNKNGVLGRQPIEAQALGTSVVAYNGHSGRSNIILNGKTGYLVNGMNEAIQRIKEILGMPQQQVKKEAREHALRAFSPETNMKKIESLYRTYLPN
jgi:glycosyltransferase involved in cell wall biosynthesis